MSDRRFRFPVAPTDFWATAARTDEYPSWWPWLRAFEARGLVAGDVWRCAVRPPLRYTVRFTVHLEEAEPPRTIHARIAGDIVGTARLRVDPDGNGCVVRLTSSLEPDGRVLGLLTRLAGPLARRGHDWILATGAEQFTREALRT